MTVRRWTVGGGLAILLALSPLVPAPLRADADDTSQWIPTGQHITPEAATGAQFGTLDPGLKDFPDFRVGMAVTTLVSHDAKTLLILTSGFNLLSDQTGTKPAHSSEYVFVYDISSRTPKKLQVLEVPNSDSGIVFAPDDSHFYVAGGVDDDVHVFAETNGRWAEDGAPIKLGHKMGNGLAVKPSAAGLDVTADGARLVVANRYNDSISIIDTAARKVAAELDLRPGRTDPKKHGAAGGEYPLWVQIEGHTAYVSAQRDREIDVVDFADAPHVVTRIAVKGVPNRMLLNKAQTRLYVTSDNADIVSVIDTKSNRVIATIDTEAPPGLIAGHMHFGGASPNSLALSPDGNTLYVTDGGTNALAIIPLKGRGALRVSGLVPTGWYPNSVSAAGDMLYVVNGRSNIGPNPKACKATPPDLVDPGVCRARNRYILQLSQAGFLSLPVPAAHDPRQLTHTVAANNGFKSRVDPADARVMAELRKRIKHVIYIVKENRTYDQVLGDLGRGNSDPSLALFGETVTPNEHALARAFVTLDNFYDSGEVSGEGWPWSTDARETDVGVKQIPMQYARRGQSYDVEGQNRNINVGLRTLPARRAADPATPDDPDLLPGMGDVGAPDGNKGEKGQGHLWDAALRAHLSVRNYGFHCDLSRYDPRNPYPVPLLHDPFAAKKRVVWPSEASLLSRTDPYFRGFDVRFPDFWREREWEREFKLQIKNHDMPALSLVRFMEDHMGGFKHAIDGVDTPSRQVADNDYAVGLLIQAVANSPYADSTLIFIVEDDAQDGPDHVDAHRSIAFVVGPYVKQNAVVSARYTTVNMLRTIEDILGITLMSINDAHQRPMTAVFDLKQKDWSYAAAPSALLADTKLPLTTPALPSHAAVAPPHDAAWWAARTRGYDWLEEDKIDTPAFNRLLWEGLAPGRPYPSVRSGADLSRTAATRTR
jgi:YVTN family beta-propeller protein